MKAKKSQFCVTCQFSYIQHDTGYGYCKFVTEAMSIKNINEFDTCSNWKKK